MTTVTKNSPVLKRSDPLFEKKVATQGFTHSDEIVIRVLNGQRNVGQLIEDVIHVEITDQKDPFVMYFIDISESNLVMLKEQHKLSVPMMKVHEIVTEMLERCLMGSITIALSQHPIAYAARLNPADGLFTVVEKNHYNNEVVHFSLPMEKGDDKDVQEYLASRLELSLTVASRQASNIRSLSATLEQELEQKERVLKELHDLRTLTDVRQQSSQSSHSQELSQMRMECADQKEEQRRVFEEEKEALRVQLSDLIALAQTERSAFGEERIRFQKDALDTDATLRELNRKLTSEVSARERMETEWKVTSQKKGEIESQHVAILGAKAQLEAELKLLHEQVASKTESIANQKQLLRGSEEACRKVEERLSEVQATLAETQRILHASQDQNAEQSAHIAKLEDRVAKYAERLKMKDEILRRQELAVGEQRDRYDAEHTLLLKSRDAEKIAQVKLQGVQQQLEETVKQLDETNKRVASDKEVIDYLNAQLNQSALNGGYVLPDSSSPHHNAYDPTPLYTPHTASGVHSVTPSHTRIHSQPRSTGTADVKYTPTHYDYRGGAGVSPETHLTAPYATSRNAPTTTTTSTAEYARAASYVQNTKTASLGTREDMLRTMESFGLKDEFGDVLQSMWRESPNHSDESSGSGSGLGRGAVGSGLRSSGSGVKGAYRAASDPVAAIDLAELEYYAMPSDPKRTANAGNSSSGGSPPHKTSRLPVWSNVTAVPASSSHLYDWQDPNWE